MLTSLFFFLQGVTFLLSWSCDPKEISPTSTEMKINWLDNPEDLSICNDGTPGAYYYSPAISPEFNNTFLIHLPGGAQCYDEPSCNERWNTSGHFQMSSIGFQEVCYKTGILDSSDEMSPLWGAHKVLVAYCSSDGYMGDAPASEKTWGWHMRGQRIVYATIKALVSKYGLNNSSKILLSGGSAGARGMMVLMDELIQNHLPSGAHVIAFLDSPFYLDIKPFSDKFQGFQYQEQQKAKFFNVHGIISEECDKKYQGEEAWKCLYGQYRVPLIKNKYFLVASQNDWYQLFFNIGKNPPYNANETKYAERFAEITREKLIELSSDLQNTNAYYSWVCYNHDISESIVFNYYSVLSGETQKEALQSYLESAGFFENVSNKTNEDRSSVKHLWIDLCEEFRCGHCE